MRLAAITTGPATKDRQAMLHAAEAAIRRAGAARFELVVLPELFALPYVAGEDPAGWRHLAEPLGGPTGQWAGTLARELGISLVYGLALDDGGARPLNAAILIRPDGTPSLLAAKQNLPPAGRCPFGESDHFRAGPGGVRCETFGGIGVAAIICYDRRYPESWRAALAAGADVVLLLVAGPAPDDPAGLYEAEIRTHARANAMFVLAAARCGTEVILDPPVTHDGHGLAVDCDGQILARDTAEPGHHIILDITPARLAEARHLRARRIAGRHAYSSLV